eukprot:3291816-Rhodomonas_salina.1
MGGQIEEQTAGMTTDREELMKLFMVSPRTCARVWGGGGRRGRRLCVCVCVCVCLRPCCAYRAIVRCVVLPVSCVVLLGAVRYGAAARWY